MLKRIMLSSILLITNSIYGLDDSSYANGWYWGKDSIYENSGEKQEAKKIVVSKSSKPTVTSKDVISEITKKVDEAKATAILKPTIENVADYLRIQNKVTLMAGNFSESWGQVMLKYPELDPSNKYPTNNYVVKSIQELKKVDIDQALQRFKKEFGIIFFFKGEDHLSLFQSEIITQYVDKNNIALIPVSLDGHANRYFNELTANNGRSQRLGIKVTPAIIALNVKTNKTYPLAFGISTQLELDEAIYNLMRALRDE